MDQIAKVGERIKIGTSYMPNGYGRGPNKRNVWLINDKCYAYHPKYASEEFSPLTGDLEGYIRVNRSKSFGVFHALGWKEEHESYTKSFEDYLDTQEFYDLMRNYKRARHTPENVAARLEEVKDWIRSANKPKLTVDKPLKHCACGWSGTELSTEKETVNNSVGEESRELVSRCPKCNTQMN